VTARTGIPPMRAVSGTLPGATEDAQWAYEIKWDGYRAIAFVETDHVRFQSSNLLDLTPRWPELGALWRAVEPRPAVLDGEVVALDPAGIPRFELLQRGEVAVTYVVFDVLRLDGTDAMPLPFEERRRLLRQAVTPGAHWIVSDHRIGGGRDLLAAARARGLEGVMAKRLGSPYQPGRRSPAWRKVKVRREQELVVGGWLPGTRARATTFGSLLVGYYEGDALRYGGAVGSGFDQRTLAALTRKLAELATPSCPFDPAPPRVVSRLARWVRPELVAQVAFAEWTFDGVVRQASFLGLRDDKDPHDVIREPDTPPFM
jgi:bifunctional non-homologous end joining protein LigD